MLEPTSPDSDWLSQFTSLVSPPPANTDGSEVIVERPNHGTEGGDVVDVDAIDQQVRTNAKVERERENITEFASEAPRIVTSWSPEAATAAIEDAGLSIQMRESMSRLRLSSSSTPPTPTNSNGSPSNTSGPVRSGTPPDSGPPMCLNCSTTNTPLWRRTELGKLCNACGLFYKLHGTMRPRSMRADVVRRRNRKSGEDDASKILAGRRAVNPALPSTSSSTATSPGSAHPLSRPPSTPLSPTTPPATPTTTPALFVAAATPAQALMQARAGHGVPVAVPAGIGSGALGAVLVGSPPDYGSIMAMGQFPSRPQTTGPALVRSRSTLIHAGSVPGGGPNRRASPRPLPRATPLRSVSTGVSGTGSSGQMAYSTESNGSAGYSAANHGPLQTSAQIRKRPRRDSVDVSSYPSAAPSAVWGDLDGYGFGVTADDDFGVDMFRSESAPSAIVYSEAAHRVSGNRAAGGTSTGGGRAAPGTTGGGGPVRQPLKRASIRVTSSTSSSTGATAGAESELGPTGGMVMGSGAVPVYSPTGLAMPATSVLSDVVGETMARLSGWYGPPGFSGDVIPVFPHVSGYGPADQQPASPVAVSAEDLFTTLQQIMVLAEKDKERAVAVAAVGNEGSALPVKAEPGTNSVTPVVPQSAPSRPPSRHPSVRQTSQQEQAHQLQQQTNFHPSTPSAPPPQQTQPPGPVKEEITPAMLFNQLQHLIDLQKLQMSAQQRATDVAVQLQGLAHQQQPHQQFAGSIGQNLQPYSHYGPQHGTVLVAPQPVHFGAMHGLQMVGSGFGPMGQLSPMGFMTSPGSEGTSGAPSPPSRPPTGMQHQQPQAQPLMHASPADSGVMMMAGSSPHGGLSHRPTPPPVNGNAFFDFSAFSGEGDGDGRNGGEAAGDIGVRSASRGEAKMVSLRPGADMSVMMSDMMNMNSMMGSGDDPAGLLAEGLLEEMVGFGDDGGSGMEY
ncbi:hypothetical protein HDU93_004899 [Gonapodya sp. JEL0774]|nr:hypothetical protein HDU93_004899 [Gonapodya sp. JEL0774]